MSRTGRRPGESGAREQILAAARAGFATRGYAGTTIRSIARDASVDPALVHHYFGNKEGVFVAAMSLPFRPSEAVESVLASGTDGAGERLVRLFLSIWEQPEGAVQFIGLIRSGLATESAAAMLKEFLTRELISRVARRLGPPEARLRASLIGSHMLGIATLRYIIGVEPLASARPERIVALAAPVVQAYIDGPE